MIGLVAFSFGLREAALEPNPCNIRLAEEVARIVRSRDGKVVVVAQWEIARHLETLGVNVERVVELCEDGSYLDSRAVWYEACNLFDAYGIDEVVAVAQPILHLGVVRKLMRNHGFRVIKVKIGKIGFDNALDEHGKPLNTQPWTRSARAFLWYGFRVVVMRSLHGHDGRQSTG